MDISFGFDVPPITATGNQATFTTTMTLRVAEHLGQGGGPYRMRVDKSTEQWTVRARTAAAGAWKVCRIDIADPLTASFEKSGA